MKEIIIPRHCAEGLKPDKAIQHTCQGLSRHSIAFASSLAFLLTFIALPLHAEGFDSLLNELSGSETDQLESELADKQSPHPLLPPSSTEIISAPEEDIFAPEKNIIKNGVTLQGLDKQTARVFILDAPIGKTIEFGTLKIVVQRCETTPLDDRQDAMAFLTITDAKPNHPPQRIFSGWMIASSPALSPLDHPIYDVWVKGCKALD